MSLALALLRRGRTEAVQEYFRLCSAWWDPRYCDIPKWEASVRAGEIPDFGNNLVYGTGGYAPDTGTDPVDGSA
jgi:hypothetical protein